MTFRNRGVRATAPDLYLPSNPQTLLAALASALGQGHPAQIVYLDDAAPLPDHVRAAIQRRFPDISLSVRSDREAIAEFANLPRFLPAVLRRNLAFRRGRGLCRPADAPPAWLGPHYRTAHIYLSGNFLSKTLRRRCDTLVLREEGLLNYHSLRFGPGKALLRLASGKSPRRHYMGEESWIDRIELDDPQALPPRLRAKARQLGLAQLMQRLSPELARDIAALFWQGPLPDLRQGGALLLTQPLDQVGICSTAEKQAIYRTIRDRLTQAGLNVVIKRHPREADRADATDDEVSLPAFFPIEAWPWLTRQKFDLAVALCTAALNTRGGLFSHRQVQLVDPGPFGRKQLGDWQGRLDRLCAEYRPPAAAG
ncbi:MULTISPECIES: polysialyltransferase family glycosyltransferase [unclassified Paracoccus (in: a-proteobacteria)]|uniref:polysialyltransferase family glycosyltransferase n=1 Tax=unclassified Paracoccus (in: a-proteobacteria) TaxID=2688777 RepID=UPI0012B41E0C|nr:MULTISPECIES: polysialyltransferase family glycosyltransferase [unclassified Paracoccus (in: a-proteobacteria)]UXU74440.1 alpha-2,8-polysialyltransferase family protein [Paracoccus sp. SMMA_5]UXU80331.1 alpha-2,8-polysialyltransferase family protein [Paracoccus sp. SMMA_5_TC]